jgi:FkbM family methyltransferase
MLINLRSLCNKYKFLPKGVVHIGAHKGEEIEIYDELGIEDVVWIEANPKIFEILKGNILKFKKQKAFNFLISDVDNKEYVFYITNNGESSSILELDKHKTHHPHIHVTETINLNSKKIDTIIEENCLDMNQYNFLNLDIQGAELMALKGFIENLKYIDYIYTEVNSGEVYKNCAKIEELDSFLKEYSFERVETSMTKFEWGDAFYIKKNK